MAKSKSPLAAVLSLNNVRMLLGSSASTSGTAACISLPRISGDGTLPHIAQFFPLDILNVDCGILSSSCCPKGERMEKLDIPQGTLDLMILTMLRREPMHGYGISQKLAELSHDTFQVNPGSL